MRWRQILFNNLGWKLLSFALAVMIWSGAQNLEGPLQTVVERSMAEVPIRLLASPQNAQPVRLDPPTTQLDLAGETFLVKRLRTNDALVYVEMTPDPLEQAVTNRIEVRLPAGVRLLNLLPNRVVITPLDRE